MWSVGVVAYIMLSGYPPFYSERDQELFEQVRRGEFEMERPEWTNVSEEAKSFVSALLVVDPETRLTAEQALNHPFMQPPMVKAARG
jgi:calcium/calmodulin-dependent protein kinase I